MNDEVTRLLRAVPALEAASGVRLVVIGGVARGIWAPARNTQDVDVVADSDDLAPLIAAAGAGGLVVHAPDNDKMSRSGMARLRLPEHLTGRVRLDIIAATHPYYARVVDRARDVEVGGLRVRVACAEDIVVLKVMADRPQDRADVAAILDAQGEALDRDLVRRELADLGFEIPAALQG